MAKLKARVTVITVPHPNPQAAIDVVANIIVKQLLEEEKKQLKTDFDAEGGEKCEEIPYSANVLQG
ncbi:hypothetical protein BR63_11315 [Thermanaerosceptrum fracticalcis]|uniref:Uncharacterized protein n=1 Tax=Thermanaerosceptrum fracticalcis TaxID=1712410 RepID=A0A7G6E443_THEFR|nr:hypothetical protein [Thermanaerosceptrum fracticalcis]QNB46847.1 hypothetical protein BR63_11315 [Thermanaerosceptrum fracticalcis]